MEMLLYVVLFKRLAVHSFCVTADLTIARKHGACHF